MQTIEEIDSRIEELLFMRRQMSAAASLSDCFALEDEIDRLRADRARLALQELLQALAQSLRVTTI